MGLYVSWLADAARTTGYRVVEVSGWRSRGHGGMRVVEGVVGHHTATPATAPGDFPSLGIVTTGRSDLAGPLCNLGLGRDGTIYVVAAGTAYHAGASAWAGYTDLNDEFVGIEAESPGTGTWTAAQRDCYPKLIGALLHYMNRPASRYAGHKDVCLPQGRKIDPAGLDTGWMRDRALDFLAGGGSAAPGKTPVKFPYDDEERNVELKSGTGLSRSLDIPAGATQIRINCPIGQLAVTALYQAGDNLPAPTEGNPTPFDWKWSYEGSAPFIVDALRPWVIDVADGATNLSVFWTYSPENPERSGSISFR